MLEIIGIAVIAYCALIYMMGKIIGDMTKSDQDLLDDLEKTLLNYRLTN